MGLTSIFKFFQPKDKIFYELFEKVTDNIHDMAREFYEGLQTNPVHSDELLKKMYNYEHINDGYTHDILTQLNVNFITPFDREDIHSLASELDDIADYIYSSTKYLTLYKTPHQDSYAQFAKLIYDATIEIQKAMKNLRGFKNVKEVKESCIKINSIENAADELLSKSLVELFESTDAMDVIKISSVLNYLEVVTDKAENVANTIETIMIKYA